MAGLLFSTVQPDESSFNLVGLLRSLSSGILVRNEPVVIDRPVQLERDTHEGEEEDGEQNYIPMLGPEFTQASEIPDAEPMKQGPKVLTKDGIIRGITVDKAHIFYGIPFADPPVAAYRWKPPRPATPWKGEYDATYPRAACMQGCTGPISETCPAKVGMKLKLHYPSSYHCYVDIKRLSVVYCREMTGYFTLLHLIISLKQLCVNETPHVLQECVRGTTLPRS